MAYTHTMEMIVDGIDLQADLDFAAAEHGVDCLKFKVLAGEEFSLRQHSIVQDFLCAINRINKELGNITKIEIVAK